MPCTRSFAETTIRRSRSVVARALAFAVALATPFGIWNCADASRVQGSTPPSENDASPASTDASSDAVERATPAGFTVQCPTPGRCALEIAAPAAVQRPYGTVSPVIEKSFCPDSAYGPLCALSPIAEAFCVRLDGGKIACWGDNHHNQIDGTNYCVRLSLGYYECADDAHRYRFVWTTDYQPIDWTLVDNNPATSAPKYVEGIEEAVELDRGCAVLGNGDTVCWLDQVMVPEFDVLDALDSGAPDASSAPDAGARRPLKRLRLPPASEVHVTHLVGCARLKDGATMCWGDRASGQVPDGSRTGVAATPQRVTFPGDPTITGIAVGAPFVRRLVEWEDGVGQVATLLPFPGGASYGRADRARTDREGGGFVSWGSAASLGRVSSFEQDPVPTPLELTNVTFTNAAGPNACAIANGDVYCWGPGRERPLRVGVQQAVRVATTWMPGSPPFGRGCAVLANGDIDCWGDNTSGQAGDGTRIFAPSPVKVADLPEPAVEVEVTQDASCAILVSGSVYCWGSNVRGQLGSPVNGGASLKPVKVDLP